MKLSDLPDNEKIMATLRDMIITMGFSYAVIDTKYTIELYYWYDIPKPVTIYGAIIEREEGMSEYLNMGWVQHRNKHFKGYRHTRSTKKYLRRLMMFAGISQPIYFHFVYGRMPESAAEFLTHWNVLFTLALGLIVMMLFDSDRIQTASSLILLGVLISLAHFGDWSYLIPAWTIIFFCYYKRDNKKMIVLFALASVTLQTLVYAKQFDSFALFSFQYGTLFALIPITMYNGQRGNVRHKKLNRWFFYVYYPAHMVVLLVIHAALN